MSDFSPSANAIIDDFVAPVCQGEVEIIYQDEALLVINKPSGLLSLSGKNPLNWDSVHYRLVNGQQGKTA
ncbi:MAG: tRNA pseudouridine32 synthase/23S rRNA pseudouridine746 synthase, partial [Psychrobacter glaciei]